MDFLLKLKNDDNVKQALKNTGSNIADLTSEIFVNVRDEDIPNLSQKLEETGFFSNNPKIGEAFALKQEQLVEQ